MAEQSVLEFAGLLRQLRAAARLTQEELAEAASLSPRSVSDLERGINRTARKDTAVLLAGALGLAEPARAVFVAAARGGPRPRRCWRPCEGKPRRREARRPGGTRCGRDALIWGWCRSGSGTSGFFTVAASWWTSWCGGWGSGWAAGDTAGGRGVGGGEVVAAAGRD